jgi:hypothetical protein
MGFVFIILPCGQYISIALFTKSLLSHGPTCYNITYLIKYYSDINVNNSLCVIKNHDMKTCDKVQKYFHQFLTLAGIGVLLRSLSIFTHERAPGSNSIRALIGSRTSVEETSITPPEMEPRSCSRPICGLDNMLIESCQLNYCNVKIFWSHALANNISLPWKYFRNECIMIHKREQSHFLFRIWINNQNLHSVS